MARRIYYDLYCGSVGNRGGDGGVAAVAASSTTRDDDERCSMVVGGFGSSSSGSSRKRVMCVLRVGLIGWGGGEERVVERWSIRKSKREARKRAFESWEFNA